MAGGGGVSSECPGPEPPNPRKRKKVSRACDFCHVNHQPCDNGQPRCSVCVKHDKLCEYLRPTKRRGPQKGYRNALNSYKESAAAWGAVLAAIPGLDALIENHLLGQSGKALVQSVKEPSQHDALIANWQASSVFKVFFGGETDSAGGDDSATGGPAVGSSSREGGHHEVKEGFAPGLGSHVGERREDEDEDEDEALVGDFPDRPAEIVLDPRLAANTSPKPSAMGCPGPVENAAPLPTPSAPGPLSLTDIVARDAARSSTRQSRILAPLGFAPNETLADFYDMGGNPEPISEPQEPAFDPEMAQIFYELGMGGRLPS